jgi:cytidylate kinase
MAVITFSREAHSGTQDLARVLAKRLGYRYIGRDDLTRAVAARSGVKRQPHGAETEGRSLSRLEQIGEQLTGEREAYIAALKAVITELALADNVVIVGHGAGHFLADMRSVVRIFVVAPVADRAARLQAEQPELDSSRARQMIESQDRESAEYLRYVFGIDWLDPHQWDLVINTGRVGPEVALDMLVSYTRSLVRDRAEAADLQRQDLATRLEQALIKDDLGVDHLRIRFESNALILEGEALTLEDRERTEAIARSLAAETTLVNQIVVRPPSSA